MKKIKLTYIGGGSKLWARVFMNDLALTEGLSGEIALYDVDEKTAACIMAIISDETKIPLNQLIFKSIKALN